MNANDIHFVEIEEEPWGKPAYSVVINGKVVGALDKSEYTDRWLFYRRTPTFLSGVEFDYQLHPEATAVGLDAMKSRLTTMFAD